MAVEPAGFADGLVGGQDGKEVVRDDCWVSRLSNQGNGGATFGDGETLGSVDTVHLRCIVMI